MMELTIVRHYSRAGRRPSYAAFCTHGKRNDSDYGIDGVSFVDAQVVRDALRSTTVSFGQNCVPEIENAEIRLYPGIDCQLVACRQHVVATHGDEAILGPIKTECLPNLACRKRCPAGIATSVRISDVIEVSI